jgi:antitoxin component of MazEF toxin-antitoxin module
MIKTLTTFGDVLALVIEPPVLERLGIDRETLLEVRTDGEALIIRPVRESHRSRVTKAAEKAMSLHATTLAKLTE